MPRSCVINGCPNGSRNPKNTVHLFPSDTIIRDLWYSKIRGGTRVNIKKLDNFGICSRHFADNDYKVGYECYSRKLVKGAVPTLFLSVNHSNTGVTNVNSKNEIGEVGTSCAIATLPVGLSDAIYGLKKLSSEKKYGQYFSNNIELALSHLISAASFLKQGTSCEQNECVELYEGSENLLEFPDVNIPIKKDRITRKDSHKYDRNNPLRVEGPLCFCRSNYKESEGPMVQCSLYKRNRHLAVEKYHCLGWYHYDNRPCVQFYGEDGWLCLRCNGTSTKKHCQ